MEISITVWNRYAYSQESSTSIKRSIRPVRFVKYSGTIFLDNATMSMFIGKTLPDNPPLKGAVFHIDLTINYNLAGY